MPQSKDGALLGAVPQLQPTQEQGTDEQGAQLLIEILNLAHPLMAEAIYCAALPHFYGLPLFSAIRHQDDNRNEGLIPRLLSYSFVIPLASQEESTYRVRTRERTLLHQMWIQKDAAGYCIAHRRAMHYWENASHFGDTLQEQESLYHRFFVNLDAAIAELVRLFRKYYNERHLAAIEHLLVIGQEAQQYLTFLGDEIQPAQLTRLQQMLMHLTARLAQLHGDWAQSQGLLNQLRHQETLDPRLAPFVNRAYGNTLAQAGQYVEAIAQLEIAMAAFKKQMASDAGAEPNTAEMECALTMIDLGEAYLKFAQSTRGLDQQELVPRGLWGQIQNVFFFLTSLSLVIYLSFYLGRRVWYPRFRPTLRHLDWIIARLFATGAYYFQKADPILERSANRSEGIVADERLAQLYLAMGDTAQAADQFADLLQNDEATLGPYRRAVVQVGLGEAYIGLERPLDARHLLQQALPTLVRYADTNTETHSRALLGEALLRTGSSAAGLEQFATAISAYTAREQWLKATNVAERLDAVVTGRLETVPQSATQNAGAQIAASELVAQAGAISNSLPLRAYSVRYYHPILVLFRRLLALMLPMAVVLTLLLTVGLNSDVKLTPTIEFRASPILNTEEVTLRQSAFSQGVTAARLDIIPDSDAAIPWLISVTTGYLGLSLLVGVFVIAYTPLRTIQQRKQSSTIQLDAEGITKGDRTENEGAQGDDDSPLYMRWQDVTRLVKADTCLWRIPIPSSSSFGLDADPERLVVGASTAWYSALRQRVEATVPATVQVLDLDYSIGRSKLALLYLLNLLLLLAVALTAWLAPSSSLLWQALPGVNYRVADAYPYLYFGLIAIPLWWGVVRPLQIVGHLGRRGRIAWGMIAGALLLVLLQIVLLFRPLLTVPDIYPPLICTVALISAAFAIWTIQIGDRRVFSPWVRWSITILITLVCALMVSITWREISAYHLLVQGTALRDQAQAGGPSDRASDARTQALAAYERAEERSRQPIWGFIHTDNAITRSFGLPPRDNFTRLIALKNAAALSAQLKQGEKSIRLYNALLEITEPAQKDQVHAWRALALQSANTSDVGESPTISSLRVDENSYEITTDNSAYAQSLQDYNAAINLNPTKPQYYLWRGVTHHTLGNLDAALADYAQVLELAPNEPEASRQRALAERARSGIGWIFYDRKEYAAARTHFTQATETEPTQPEARLGLGYAEYALGNLDAAEAAWEMAAAMAPMDPVVRISLGTLHWKRGVPLYNPDRARPDENKEQGCHEYARAIAYFTQATDRAQLRAQEDAEVAFTFRTRAQVEWLLRKCPQAGSEVQGLKQAINSYTEAIKLAPTNAFYWQMRGRIAYVLYLRLLDQDKAQAIETLFSGLADMQKALELDTYDSVANDYIPNRRLKDWYQPAVNNVAHAALRNRDEEQAIALYQALVAAAFNAADGLSILQQTLDELTAFLATNPQIDASAARSVLIDASTQLQRGNAAAVLEQSLAAFETNSNAVAIQEFHSGVELAIVQRRIDAIADSALAIRAMTPTTATLELLNSIRINLPRLANIAAADSRTILWTKLGAIYLALDAPSDAAKAYAEAIRLTSEDSSQYQDLRSARQDWRSLWQHTGVNAAPLLSALKTHLSQQVEAYPKLDHSGYYWGIRAWFYYFIGREAFRLEDEDAARRALDLGQPDADHAFANGWTGSDQVQTYLREGAWPWYHVERGDDLFAAARYADALTDYVQAIESPLPQENPTALQEQVISSLKGMLTLVALERPAEAEPYLHWALIRAGSIAGQGEIEKGANALGDYLLAHPEIDEIALYTALLPERSTSTLSNESERRGQNVDTRVDLYWRYRAEFGFRLLNKLFLKRPQHSANYEAIFAAMLSDIEQANTLNSAAHQNRRDFFVDANIGWFYLQRANAHYTDDNFEAALADYAAAAQRIVPASENATQDLTDALFQAGLTSLRTGDEVMAQMWYANGIALVQERQDAVALDDKVRTAIEKLNDWRADARGTSAALQPLLASLGALIEEP